MNTLDKIGYYFDCDIDEIVEHVGVLSSYEKITSSYCV